MNVKFQNILHSFQTVDPKNPGSWPWVVKGTACVVLFLVVVLAGYLLDWQDQFDTLAQRQAEEEQLKQSFLAKKKDAVNLDIIKKQLQDTQQALDMLLKQLPDKTDMDALLTDINRAGQGRGVTVDLFKPGGESVQGELIEQPISLQVEGGFNELGGFTSDIAQLPRIIILSDVNITSGSQQAGTLSMSATAKTYRYPNESEKMASSGRGRR
jgi:type IV pilus assembly protein PilO